MGIPLLDVGAQNLPLAAELRAAFDRVLRTGIFIQGPEVEGFEAELADWLGVDHAIGVSSGTDALLLALMALGIGPGDEVLVPAFTFFATAGCVSRVGATPVFVDVCPVCFNIDPVRAAAKVTARTRAIMPVHLFGQSADLDALEALTRAHGLHLIEDTAQAIGAGCRGRRCGTVGDFGAYSFFPSKNLGGFGDGGLLVTADDRLAAMARSLRTHGMEPKYFHSRIGGNFRLDALQAALLRVKLPHLAEYAAGRRANAADYVQQLGSLPGVMAANPADCCSASAAGEPSPAEGVRIILPVASGHAEHVWNQFTLRVPGPGQREALRRHLSGRGIGCEVYYPLSLDQQDCFQSIPAASRTGCDRAHQLAAEVLSLPVYPELTPPQRTAVVDAIGDFVAGRS